MSIYILLTVVITICSLLYAYFQNGYKYWEKRGFPYLEPKFPKGNSKKFLTLKKNLGLETSEFYDEIKRRSWKFGGVYTVLRPVLIVVDPDIIGDILVRVSIFTNDFPLYPFNKINFLFRKCLKSQRNPVILKGAPRRFESE